MVKANEEKSSGEWGESMLKSIVPSVLASCIVALIMGGTTFIGTLSRMNMMFDIMEKRITILENNAKDEAKAKKELEISIARTEVLLKQLMQELKEARSDIKTFHGNH